MSNFRLFFNRIVINWHVILVFSICLLSIHFFFLNDYHLQVQESQVGAVYNSAIAQPTSEPVSPVYIDTNANHEESSGSHVEAEPDHSNTSKPHQSAPHKGEYDNSNNETTDHSEGIPENSTVVQENKSSDGPGNNTGGSLLNSSTEEYLAVCVAMKDQTRDLPEWLTHHYHHAGVKHFYIMDDGSNPPISTHDMDYGIPKSAITFHYQPRDTRAENMQMVFYQQCQEWWGSNHTWIAYIDGDEFLEATGDETVEDVLRSFDPDESVGALGVHWKMHNSNGLLTRPESARKGFTTCLWDSPHDYNGGTDDNHHIKSIVKTSKYLHWSNPHKFDLKDDANTVTEHGDVVTTPAWRSPITRDRIALHHYAVKSRQEYEEKMHRSNGMSEPKNEGFWDHMENTPTVVCNEMAKYNP
jgi:hypothetical protein